MVFADRTLADAYWKSLKYFNIYRLIIGVLLAGSALLPWDTVRLSEGLNRPLFAWASLSFLSASVLSLVLVLRYRRRFNIQLGAQVITDVVLFCLMIFASGGLRSGIAVMLLVTLAGAGLVGQGRLVLFYAALAAIGVLVQQVFLALETEFVAADFFLAGVLSIGFFGVAATARLLARRVVANEELARRRGVALQRQMQVSEQVISRMQDGVLVVSANGALQQVNPRARELLALDAAGVMHLAILEPALADTFATWRVSGVPEDFEFRARASGKLVHARFVRVGGEGEDHLIFLSDVGEQRTHAQRLKLAALGRLTANIAHEIRNPLSAIQHSAELIKEEQRDPGGLRLLRILLDNTKRLEGIVNDVLQLGRRDRVQRERVALDDFLPGLVEQLLTVSRVPAGTVDLQVSPGAAIAFDRAHLYQVLSNVLGNALRYSLGEPGSVRLWVRQAAGETVIHIADDGPGVAAEARGKIFEPFFTTDPKGTGLGLYIARELAEANGARLELVDNSPGAHFCLAGGTET